MSPPAVCFGSPSPEHDISVLTGLQAARALLDRGHDVTGIFWDKQGAFWRVDAGLEAPAFADGAPRGAQPLRLAVGPEGGFLTEGRLGRSRALDVEAVVNCCHGVPGEDGTLQSALDLAGIRYTGPSVAGAALGMDKLAFAGVAAAAGLGTLPRLPLTDPLPPEAFDLRPPLIVKPRFGGSSIGIEVVDDLDTAAALLRTSPHLTGGAVVEPYRADAVDLNVAVRTWPTLAVSAVERPLRSPDGRIYSYAEKYLQGGEGMASAPRELPADVPEAVAAAIDAAARRLIEVAMVGSAARIDFLLVDGEVLVNEVNTIPGALGWYFWAQQGVPFGELVESLIDEATSSPGRAFRADGADGSALRTAGSIAAKLG